MTKLVLTLEWDKTFPKSDKVDHKKVTFHNRYGIELAADMYWPKVSGSEVAPLSGREVTSPQNLTTSKPCDPSIQDDIVRDYIQLILDYCKRFYARQFKEMSARGNDILARFQQVLIDYYATGRQRTDGLPSVKYCASELCLSPGYFGDIVRSALGESPKDYIRSFVIHRAKSQILAGRSIAQVADDLGFEYSQHFTRMFKNAMGQTPSEFLAEQRKK